MPVALNDGMGGYLVANRHVVTGRSSLDEDRPILDSNGNEVIAPSALRIAMPSRERPGVWKPVIYDLGDKEYLHCSWRHRGLDGRDDGVAA